MGEHSIDNKWNAHQPIEGVFVKELQHNSFFIKEEFPVDNFDVSDFIKQEQSEETSSSGSTVIEDGVIVSTDVVSISQESIVIKDELIVKDPEHEELEQQFSLTNISLQTTEKSFNHQAHSSQPMESDVSKASSQPKKLVQEKVMQDWTKVNIKNDKASHFTEDKLVQSNINKYQCHLCNKAFTHCRNLSRHKLTTHLGIKKYQCDICNNAFIQLGHLSQHKLTHSTIKKYECDVCNKTFTQFSGLAVHKRTHSEVRKYQCDVCDKAFKQSSHLSTHKLTHSGIKNYNCGDCGKAFTRARSITKHKLIHNAL